MYENSTKINAILTKPLHIDNTTMESQYPPPLISTIVTLYTLIFLYFPTNIAASPLIISTSLLLLSLLRLGAAQRISQHQTEKNEKPDSVVDPDPLEFHADDCSVEFNVDTNCEKDSVFDPDHDPIQFHDDAFVDSNVNSISQKESMLDPEPDSKPEPRPFYEDCFVEWNVRAPLEVIYEAYEGEEEEEYTEEKRDEELRVIERYASLSMYYPETDTDTDSSSDGDSPEIGNWDSPENVCFRWDDDEDREELIEIELDCKRNSEVEEENLIEIDLTPASFPVTGK